MVGVHATRRTEVGQAEAAAAVLNAFAQHIKGTAALNLRPNPNEEFFGRLGAVLEFQSLIHFRLRAPNEAQQLLANQAGVFVVVGWR